MRPIAALIFCLAGSALGQGPANLGIFEGASDVGSPSHKGSVAFDAATKEYKVIGGGNNMWAAKDDMYFVWKQMSGDVMITANMKIVSEGAAHRKAGLMIRKTLDTGSPYADIIVHGSGLTGIQWREKADDISRGVHFPIESPTRIRIVRKRGTVTVWVGKEGVPFQEAASLEFNSLGNPVYVGMAVCPHDDKAETTVVFSDVSIEKPPAQ